MLVRRGKASILIHLKAVQYYFARDKCSYIFFTFLVKGTPVSIHKARPYISYICIHMAQLCDNHPELLMCSSLTRGSVLMWQLTYRNQQLTAACWARGWRQQPCGWQQPFQEPAALTPATPSPPEEPRSVHMNGQHWDITLEPSLTGEEKGLGCEDTQLRAGMHLSPLQCNTRFWLNLEVIKLRDIAWEAACCHVQDTALCITFLQLLPAGSHVLGLSRILGLSRSLLQCHNVLLLLFFGKYKGQKLDSWNS